MSIDKWLNKEDLELRKKREESYKNLSKEEKLKLKKKKIKELKKEDIKEKKSEQKPNELLNLIVEFKDWLNKRTYLKGDLDKIETWIKILHKKFALEIIQTNNTNENKNFSKSKLLEDYRRIPPKLLDENKRVALSKLFYGKILTNSDNYHIRKLKSEIKGKLKEAKYYDILEKIIELK